MNNAKKIGILLLTVAVTAGICQATGEKQKPDAILQLSGGSVAAGVGVTWGHGTLTYHGKDYHVAVKGLSIGNVGVKDITARGEVYGLKDLRDFNGNYTAAGIGLTVAGGRADVTMKNQNNVRVLLNSTTRGADIGVGAGGVEMKLK